MPTIISICDRKQGFGFMYRLSHLWMIHYILSLKKKKKDTYISTSLYRLFVENDFFPSTFHIKIVINYIDLHKIPGEKKKTQDNLSFLSKNIIPSV